MNMHDALYQPPHETCSVSMETLVDKELMINTVHCHPALEGRSKAAASPATHSGLLKALLYINALF